MKILKKISRAEWCMFVITVALLFVIHGYCTMKAEANVYEGLEVTAEEPVEIIVEDFGDDDEEIMEEAEESVVRSVEGSVEPSADEYDIELGEFLYNVTAEYGVPYEMITAVVIQESGWNAAAVSGDGNYLGLMQIGPRWHQWRMDEIFGPATTFDSYGRDVRWFNPMKNIEVGCHIFRDLYETGLSEEWIVMAYNGGYMYAHQKVREGVLSEYGRSVLAMRDSIVGSVG